MADKPVVFDDDNPEWTEEDFARAKPGAEVLPAELVAALKSKGGRPKGTDRQQVTLRLPRAVIDHFKAEGPGWQTRAIAVLEREAERHRSPIATAAEQAAKGIAEMKDLVTGRRG
jgi:uncharacterized protein (DUF4415 family)